MNVAAVEVSDSSVVAGDGYSTTVAYIISNLQPNQ